MKKKRVLLSAVSALCIAFSASVGVFADAGAQDTEESKTSYAAQAENQTEYGAKLIDLNGNERYYENWSQALSWAYSGYTVQLLDNFTSGAEQYVNIRINCFNNITLDLNGFTIDMGSSYLDIITDDFTVTDSSESRTGKIVAKHQSLEVSSGSVTLDKVTIESENEPVDPETEQEARYGTVIVDGGKLNIDNAVVKGGFEAIEIKGGKVTVDGDETLIEGDGFDAIYIHDLGSKLTVNGGTIKGAPHYAIVGNGTNTATDYRGGTEININGGTIISEGIGMYLPQYGTVNMTGGSITGQETAIEIESGILNISDGELTAETDVVSFLNPKDGDGTTVTGAAVAAVCRTKNGQNAQGGGGYYGDMEINISGGTFNGVCGVAKLLYDGMDEASSMKSMTITGGTFNGKEGKDLEGGTVSARAVYVADDCADKALISGGTFNSDITPYMADGTAYSVFGGQYKVYSTDNKISSEGTYMTPAKDGDYDQMNLFTYTTGGVTENLSDKIFTINFGDGDTERTYKYKNAANITTEGLVSFGLIVTDIPEGKNVTVTVE